MTGGSRGIGRAVAVSLARTGHHVIINYRTGEDAAREALAAVEEAGGTGELLPFDVGDAVAVKTALEGWQNDNPERVIQVLVNNAGITRDNLMVFMSDDEWEKVVAVNQDGFFYVTRTLLQNMLVSKWGRIVNVVSLSGQKGLAGQVNYAASKGAVIAATKSLAQEVARKNVTVNAVSPGFIRTEMTGGLDEKELSAMVPLRRFGTPEEVAAVVSFLVSREASYITGEVISVNGGMYS